MKYFILIIVCILFSCEEKKDVLLPKSNVSIVKNVEDLSPVYIFFKTEGKDTIAEVNRKNSIISTNWIFNIDKRLPLRLVISEVMKLQEKKRAEKAHKNEKAENYYSYADSVGKNLAFLPFTKVYYKNRKPIDQAGFTFYFRKKNDLVLVNNHFNIKKSELISSFHKIGFEKNPQIVLIFDEDMSYQEYIENKVLIYELESSNKVSKEFIF